VPLAARTRRARLTVARLDDAEALAAEVQVEQVGDIRVVLDHDDRALFGLHTGSAWQPSMRMV
jgi:hypothetical protein